MKKFIPAFLILSLFLVAGVALAKSENANQNSQGVLTGLSVDNNSGGNKNTTTFDEVENKGQTNAAFHKSVVSTFVHNLLDVADREGGIGAQVRVIARAQNDAATTTAEALNRVEKRNKIKRFLIGSDYKNLGALRNEMVQTRNRIEQLKNLMEQAETAADRTELQNQIQTLLQEQTRIENFVKTQESKFSLFGWLVKLFKK
jgi:hypothetical protein